MLPVTVVRGIGPKAIHSQHLLQMTRRFGSRAED